jgi:hypothetical protein
VSWSRLCAAALLQATVATSVSAAETDCTKNPNRVAPCRAVHGRLSLWNGSPPERIWVVGTRRILGVTGRSEGSLPPYLQKQLNWDGDIYGDFWVCPLFDPPKPGHMEFVCVHSWRNLILEDTVSDGANPRIKRIPAGPAPKWPGKEH